MKYRSARGTLKSEGNALLARKTNEAQKIISQRNHHCASCRVLVKMDNSFGMLERQVTFQDEILPLGLWTLSWVRRFRANEAAIRLI